jgi:hypothetical protein
MFLTLLHVHPVPVQTVQEHRIHSCSPPPVRVHRGVRNDPGQVRVCGALRQFPEATDRMPTLRRTF